MDRKTVTIQDVALAAGVSTATVSRAISSPEKVSEATRSTVMEAIRTTGYQVNVTASNLRRQRTGAIMVLVPDLGNPFFSRILAGIENATATRGYSVLFVDTKQPGMEPERIVMHLNGTRADGFISLDGALAGDFLSRHRPGGGQPPLVFACEWAEGTDLPHVAINNQSGASLAVQHLVELGHRRIGHVSGPDGNVLTTTRLEGTRESLKAHGLPIRDDWFFHGDFSLQSGAEAAEKWLKLKDRPSAVFCASDQMACGFISKLSLHGLSVPQDVSVVGFDDIDIARHYIPPLTTIHQPRHKLGTKAAELLLSQIESASPAVRDEILEVELIVRKSTAAPAGN